MPATFALERVTADQCHGLMGPCSIGKPADSHQPHDWRNRPGDYAGERLPRAPRRRLLRPEQAVPEGAATIDLLAAFTGRPALGGTMQTEEPKSRRVKGDLRGWLHVRQCCRRQTRLTSGLKSAPGLTTAQRPAKGGET
jgi:hypothetical protein